MPTQLVTWCRLELSFLTGPSSALHADRDQEREREHDRRMPQREPEPDAQRPLALAHQLAGRVVDRRDVIGVKRVAQSQRVGGDSDPDRERSGGPEAVVRGETSAISVRNPSTCSPPTTRDHHQQRPLLALGQRRPERCNAAPVPACVVAACIGSRSALPISVIVGSSLGNRSDRGAAAASLPEGRAPAVVVGLGLPRARERGGGDDVREARCSQVRRHGRLQPGRHARVEDERKHHLGRVIGESPAVEPCEPVAR